MERRLELVYKVLLIRVFEDKVCELISRGLIKQKFVHLSHGEEAVAVGVLSHMRDSDVVFASHRNHAYYIASGGDMSKLFAEILGHNGCSRGYGGSMHVVDFSARFLGSSSIVGGIASVATGYAYDNDSRVFVFFGDGATEEGVFYESMNIAGLYRLPVVYAMVNNRFAYHRRIDEFRVNPDVYKIVREIGVDGFKIDGSDVFRVYWTVAQILDDFELPVFIQFETCRMKSHTYCDDNPECREYRDPVEVVKLYVNDDEYDELKNRAIDAVERSLDVALNLVDELEVMWR